MLENLKPKLLVKVRYSLILMLKLKLYMIQLSSKWLKKTLFSRLLQIGRFDENIAKYASMIDFTPMLKQCHFSECTS